MKTRNAHLVAADERRLRGDGPVALRGVQISVAHTGALHLQQTLAGRELRLLGHRPVVDDLEVGAGGAHDSGLHGLWNLELRHGVWWGWLTV